ncbi:MAG: Clp protease ClpC, partial [Candidatus Marinimicrobia bacterium]|nr:Clp protease ClpC [Candidatus Neomarinimicrobiota bacterium]
SEAIEILKGLQSRYEKHHNVSYSEEAVRACVYFSDRYITDKFLPDKAIDVMDEAGSRAHILNIKVPQNIIDLEFEIEKIRTEKNSVVMKQRFEDAASLRDKEQKLINKLNDLQIKWKSSEELNPSIISEENIADVVSTMTRIPVTKVAESESKKLLKMSDELSEKIIGQNQAIEILSKAVQRSRAGLKREGRPIGVYLFLGPTGVGKTETVKELASYLFNKQDSLVRLDMSEYGERFSVSRLIGAPPGYVGYEEGGELTEKVRRNPYSIVLFDEIEKAHPDIFNLLLQLFDEGVLTDNYGRKIDFQNTIIILTSNIGTKEIQNASIFGFNEDSSAYSNEKTKRRILEKVNNIFNPEFVNRLDETVIFNILTKENVLKIIDLQLADLFKNLEKIGFALSITKKAKVFLAEKGYSAEYGARNLKREIQSSVENPLSEMLLSNMFEKCSKIKIDFKKGQLVFEPVAANQSKKTKKSSKI